MWIPRGWIVSVKACAYCGLVLTLRYAGRRGTLTSHDEGASERPERSRMPYLDLTEVMRRQTDGPERLYLLQRDPATNALTGNAHLSREGNAVIGASVAAWLETAGLLAR